MADIRATILAGCLVFFSCASGSTLVPGKYGVQIDSNNAQGMVSLAGAEDLEVTLRAAFASRLENVEFYPRLDAKAAYDAIIFVRLNLQRPRGDHDPNAVNRSQVGLEYEITTVAGTLSTGFVEIRIREWPPVHMTSEQVYSALSNASEDLAGPVAQDLQKKARPPKANPRIQILPTSAPS